MQGADAAPPLLTSTTTITFGPGSSIFSGQLVTYTATITGTGAIPTGSVTFSVDGSSLSPLTLDPTGKAVVMLSATVGTRVIGAAYSGDQNYVSSFNSLSVTAARANTAIAMSPNTAQVAQPVAIRAVVSVVSPGVGTPIGTVAFSSGNIIIAGCAAQPTPGGIATCNTSFASAGNYNIVADYSGDSATAPSNASLSLTTGKAVAGVTLSALPVNPSYGATVTINVSVLGVAGVAAPTGTVTISDGGASLSTVPLGADGRASLLVPGPIPAFNIGPHSLVATYGGDANYTTSPSTVFPLVVGAGATGILFTATPAQIAQPVRITATLSVAGTGGGTATGTMAFTNGGTPIANCTATPVQAGVAVCTTSFPQIGTFAIGAAYSGDPNTSAGTGSTQVVVGRCNAGAFLVLTPPSPAYGAPVTMSALLLGATGVPTPTGSVTFLDQAAIIGTVPLDSTGRATLVAPSGSLAALSTGSHSISLLYNSDANYLTAAADPQTLVVGKGATGIALTSTVAQVAQPVKITASLTVATGSAAPGGTIDFNNGGIAIVGCTGLPVQNGVAICSTSFPQVATLSIGASYSGDTNNGPGTASVQLAVGKCNAAAFLASLPAAPVFGTPISLGALVLGAVGVAAPTGTVTFSDGTAVLGSLPLGSDGRAALVAPSISVVALGAGPHSITAVYSGDANYLTATAPVLPVTVSKAAATVVLTASPTSPKPGQAVTLTATITPASGTGTVAFNNGADFIAGCTAVPFPNGVATCTTSFAQPGTITIGANYSGDANATAGSGTLPLSVTQTAKPAPIVSLTALPLAPVFGTTVTFSLSVAASAGGPTPTGTIVVSDGTFPLASLPLNASGQTSLSIPSTTLAPLIVGSHVINAAYSGDSFYLNSTATPLGVTMVKASTSTFVAVPTSGPFTATVTIIAPGVGVPTGQVQFTNNGVVFGTASLLIQNGNFVATLLRSSQVGSIAANYLGDTNFASSVSAPAAVTTPGALVTVTSNHNPATYAQIVTFTVTATANPGPSTPTGSVQLLVDGTVLGTAPLAGGTVNFLTTPAVGSHNVVANYLGDATYSASSGNLPQVVNKGASSLDLSSSFPTSVFGQSVTYTAQLNAQANTTSGQIQFSDGAVSIGSAPIVAGTAALAVTNLVVGSHSITASWSGDANWTQATSTAVTQTVGKSLTGTVLTSGSTSATAPPVLTAKVTPVGPGAGTPTGSVKFVNATTNAVLSAVNLTGAIATAPLPSVTDPIVAVYSGDANFQPSSSAGLIQLAVTNSASYAVISLAPDEIVTLFGSKLGTATTYATPEPADTLGGTTVKITDSAGVVRTAQILYVSPTQASVLIPSGVAFGPAFLEVTNVSEGTVSTSIVIGPVAPGLFTANGSGQSVAAAQVVLVHSNGSQEVAQNVGSFDARQSLWVPAPIDLGAPSDTVYLILYGTGIRHFTAKPTCIIGGKTAAVVYAGAQNSFQGLDQINILIPASLRGAGTVNVVLTVDGIASNTVTIGMQ